MKITLTSEESVRLEPIVGPMTIEAPSADRLYSPFHMLGSSLAYCVYSILVSWATNAGIATDGLLVDVSWTFAENPHRIGELRVSYEWPELPAGRRAAARRVATLCPVHATLTHVSAVTIEQADRESDVPSPPRTGAVVETGQRDVAAGADGVAR